MKHTPLLVVACAVALTGCIPEVTASSRTYLPSSQSGAFTPHAPADAAREVTRLLGVRGFALADQQEIAPQGGLELKLTKSNRSIAATKDDETSLYSKDVGSVFYVDRPLVPMVGKPTLNGAEPCSPDTPELACDGVTTNDKFASKLPVG